MTNEVTAHLPDYILLMPPISRNFVREEKKISFSSHVVKKCCESTIFLHGVVSTSSKFTPYWIHKYCHSVVTAIEEWGETNCLDD